MYVNDKPIILNGEKQTEEVSIEPENNTSYTQITYIPKEAFEFSSSVKVKIEVEDTALRKNKSEKEYSFSITDGIDSDEDGLPDDWEKAHGLDPTDPSGINGPNGDYNNDGILNIDEYHGIILIYGLSLYGKIFLVSLIVLFSIILIKGEKNEN